ncbi:hypothetical protein AB0F17_42745 [Nonomuraea sp. NPDC026600]|uniref:hypothetical protein n=1 Tax=Nonomuraea sp. NPDC026600 TaxID=3155363 RepID=UPI003406DA35
MYETRAYDNEAGDPVVVIVATGTHDVARLVNLLQGGSPPSEQRDLADQITRQVRRRGGGRDALRLLAEHGGPDLLTAVGDSPLLFDVAADVPAIPETGPASAVELAKSYAARCGYAMRYAHETFPKSGHPDRSAALRRARDHFNIAQYMYGVVYLLRELITHAPGQADEIAARLWDDWIDGGGSERLSDWLGAWSIDIDKSITQAIDDARAANSNLLNADEIAIRQELAAQDAKWGVQNHPVFDHRDIDVVVRNEYAFRATRWQQINAERAAHSADRSRCRDASVPHAHTAWDGILLEEVYEALAEPDPDKMAAELLQVAAVAVQWRRALLRSPALSSAITAGKDA